MVLKIDPNPVSAAYKSDKSPFANWDDHYNPCLTVYSIQSQQCALCMFMWMVPPKFMFCFRKVSAAKLFKPGKACEKPACSPSYSLKDWVCRRYLSTVDCRISWGSPNARIVKGRAVNDGNMGIVGISDV